MILPETLIKDLHYGARTLSRNPAFTMVCVLALALGIGVNTAAFTAYKALVARPLDARDPNTMVNLALILHSGAPDPSFSYLDYQAYRDQLHSFSGVIAFSPDHLNLSGAGGLATPRSPGANALLRRLGILPNTASNAEFTSTFIVSENYFSVLGVLPLRGRTFDSIPDLAAHPSVLISENSWQRRFDGDPEILGKAVRLNGASFTIVGITPHDFVGTHIAAPDFWLPLSLEPLVHPERNWLHNRENECCHLSARLAHGVTIDNAKAEMTLVAERIRTLHDPHSELAKPTKPLIWPGSPFLLPIKLYPGLNFAIMLIMAAAAMVLIIACSNVASLLLARAASRQHELSLRLSLGASRLRLIRQLVTESSMLGLIAGVVALPFTWALLRELATKFAESIPAGDGTLVFHVTPDLDTFVYVFAVSLVAGILFGIVPALQSSRSALTSTVRTNAATSRSRSLLRDSLVAAQVAVSLVLLITGSMMIRSASRALSADTGYDSKHLIDLDLQFLEGSKYTAERKAAIVRELRARLAALPGVTAISSARPPNSDPRRVAVSINGNRPTDQDHQATVAYTEVQENYFETLGIPLLLGRGFLSQAGQQDQHSVILSDSAAKHLWPGQNPIGRSLRLGDSGTWQVVGVTRDTRGFELDGSDTAQVFLPLSADRLQDHPILIRTRSDPAQFVKAINSVIFAVDPDLVATVSTLDDMLRRMPAFIAASLAAAVASTVGLLGLVLATMGIYGTVSYIVACRTREIGVRMSIGAQRLDILSLILREISRPVLVGLFTGMFLAVGASYVLRTLLNGLNIVDGISYAGVSLLFLAIALVAAYPPARRAMSVDPMVALRYE